MQFFPFALAQKRYIQRLYELRLYIRNFKPFAIWIVKMIAYFHHFHFRFVNGTVFLPFKIRSDNRIPQFH